MRNPLNMSCLEWQIALDSSRQLEAIYKLNLKMNKEVKK